MCALCLTICWCLNPGNEEKTISVRVMVAIVLAALCGGLQCAEAVEPEEPVKAIVTINISKERCGMACRGRWDITHVQTEEGQPLWKALVALENAQALRKAFASKVLDGAMRALIQGIENDDAKEEHDREYASLKRGLRCLLRQGPWFWWCDDRRNFAFQGFVPGAVRLTLGRTPDQAHFPEKCRPRHLMFEGFALESGEGLQTDWWGDTPWLCDTMD